LTRVRRAPAADRNKDAILDVLRQVLPDHGLVLEVASGTGQHVVHFAAALCELTWQPSDPDGANGESIAAYVSASGLENVAAPIAIDACDPDWPIDRADAIVCINMIHIAPWAAAEGLLRGSAGLLGPGKPLVLYGPFMRGGRHTAQSNADFDVSLKRRSAEWGVRDLDDLAVLAQRYGLELESVVEMPANNLTVVFRRGRVTA